MKQKKKYSLMKHLDFLLLDLLCVEICFFGACMVRKNTFLEFCLLHFYLLQRSGTFIRGSYAAIFVMNFAAYLV